jgi:hypothetical protein
MFRVVSVAALAMSLECAFRAGMNLADDPLLEPT